MGQVKILDHYHNFLFFCNTTHLETAYETLVTNSKSLEQISKRDKLTFKTFHHLFLNIEKIKHLINKFNYGRVKRGLVNIVGKAIKFITGNLDDDDLKMINDNLEKLHNNQNSGIDKINQLTSFANHLSQRYSEDVKLINKNLQLTQDYIKNVSETENIRLVLQNEIYQSETLLNTLLMFERTISFSLNQIPNLELIRVDELLNIHKFLEKTYNSVQLLAFDRLHLFKLLQATKLFVIGSDQALTFLIKVPILKPYVANYSQIYPTPNNQSIVIIPPKKYVININNEDHWTDETCQQINEISLCLRQPLQETCTLQDLRQCPAAKISNQYDITHVLNNKQLLVLFKNPKEVTEDCHGILTKQSVVGVHILSSTCRLIIDTSIYDKTMPTFEIQINNQEDVSLNFKQEVELQLRHLKTPEDLLKEAQRLDEQPVYLYPISQILHFSVSTSMMLTIIILSILLIRYRQRILDLLCKPRKIIRIRGPIPNLNEDVQN